MPDVINESDESPGNLPSFGIIALIISTPLLLILISTFVKLGIDRNILSKGFVTELVVFIGHPFTALIIATLFSILLSIKRKLNSQKILELSRNNFV